MLTDPGCALLGTVCCASGDKGSDEVCCAGNVVPNMPSVAAANTNKIRRIAPTPKLGSSKRNRSRIDLADETGTPQGASSAGRMHAPSRWLAAYL